MEDEKYRILVVEDSETQAILLRLVLESQGWEVFLAESAEKAFDVLSDSLPDLIIVDNFLPGIHGDEFCRRLKMNVKTRSIPAAILTVDDEPASMKRGLESGADDYIPKDINEDLLLLRIKTLLRKSRTSLRLMEGTGFLFQRSRILAVDDSPTYLEFLKQSFEQDGIQIHTAVDGMDALDCLDKEKFDCILIDLVMPGINGIELCRRIFEKQQARRDHLVVLMLTAHESKDDMTRSLEAGADDFVGKSNDISIIKARLGALLRRKFIQEDNQRIYEELKKKEIETERSRLEKEAAQAKAALSGKLEKLVEKLKQEIGERKRIESELMETMEELNRSNMELEQFAYIASHDLMEPLRTVSSYVQLLAKRYKDKLDPDADDFIQFTVDGVARMKALINDILIYSRVGTRNRNFIKTSMDMAVDNALINLKVALEEKDTEIIKAPLPTVMADETQLVQLFQNLIGNALKFRDKKKLMITISAEKINETNIRIPAQTIKKGWVISISDNGIGIESRHFERIFQIFQRLHTREEFLGTGIGLAVCKKIVERHGGLIWVESESGKGSTFYFTIPDEGP